MVAVIRPSQPGLPPASSADPHGLVALGGDLSVERLVLAYRTGIFPWYSEGMPIQWHSPPERFVLVPHRLHVPRSLAKRIRRGSYRVTFDRAFASVIRACATASRVHYSRARVRDATGRVCATFPRSDARTRL